MCRPTLRLHTTFRTKDGMLTQRLKGLTIDLSHRGKLFNKGLPSCTVRQLEPSSVRRAIGLCGNALVGSGRLHAIVALPEQSPFRFRARLLAFNGPPGRGQRTILVLAYEASPQTSFVLPFVIHRSGFDLGTRLTTQVPKDAGASAHIGGFTIVINRTFTYRGKLRSYIKRRLPGSARLHRRHHPFRASDLPFRRYPERRNSPRPRLPSRRRLSIRVRQSTGIPRDWDPSEFLSSQSSAETTDSGKRNPASMALWVYCQHERDTVVQID